MAIEDGSLDADCIGLCVGCKRERLNVAADRTSVMISVSNTGELQGIRKRNIRLILGKIARIDEVGAFLVMTEKQTCYGSGILERRNMVITQSNFEDDGSGVLVFTLSRDFPLIEDCGASPQNVEKIRRDGS